MDEDEYEREHMEVQGPVRFRARHSSRLMLGALVGIPLFLTCMLAFGLSWSVIAFMGALGAIGIAINLSMSSYRVVLTDAALHVQYGLRTRRIPIAAIEKAVSAPYRWTDAMFGSGLYRQSLDGSTQRYRAEGLRETIRVEWREGSRTKTLIVGTDRAEQLVTEIRRARGERIGGFRLPVEPLEREIFEEVEAVLRRPSSSAAKA